MVPPVRRRCLAVLHAADPGSRGLLAEKKSLRASEQNRQDVEEKRQAFWDDVGHIDPGKLVFLDESGCNTSMTTLYARAPVGERAVAFRPVNRGKNVSMVGAVALRGVVALRAVEGAVNTAKFLRYLKQDLIPNWRAADVLVMDNLRVHKAPPVRALLAEHNIQVVFLPPYSPEFNPIEMYWSLFKRILRRLEARTMPDLKAAIRLVRRRLKVDFFPLFRSCGFA